MSELPKIEEITTPEGKTEKPNPFHVCHDDKIIAKNLAKAKEDIIKVKTDMTTRRKELTEKQPFSTQHLREKAFKTIMSILNVERDLVEVTLALIKLDSTIATEGEYFEEDLADMACGLGWAHQILKTHQEHCDGIMSAVSQVISGNTDRIDTAKRLSQEKLVCHNRHVGEKVIGKNMDDQFICAKC